MPPHPSIFFKRALFTQLGFYELGFAIGADYELITRFFLKGKKHLRWLLKAGFQNNFRCLAER